MSELNELIEHHIIWCEARSLSPRTIEQRRRVLQQADRELPYGVEMSSAREIERWLSNRRWKTRTRRCYHNHLSGLFRWATAGSDPILDYNPIAEVPKPRRPRAVSRHVPPDEVEKVLARAVDPYRTYILFALGAGLRCCEIAGLHREDVTADEITIRCAKGGDEESVPTHPVLWEHVKNLWPGPIAETVGGFADPKQISSNTAKYLKRLGFPYTLHQFRHSFATELRRQGHDLFVVQKLMRHESAESTKIYVHVGKRERLQAVATLPIPTPQLMHQG